MHFRCSPTFRFDSPLEYFFDDSFCPFLLFLIISCFVCLCVFILGIDFSLFCQTHDVCVGGFSFGLMWCDDFYLLFSIYRLMGFLCVENATFALSVCVCVFDSFLCNFSLPLSLSLSSTLTELNCAISEFSISCHQKTFSLSYEFLSRICLMPKREACVCVCKVCYTFRHSVLTPPHPTFLNQICITKFSSTLFFFSS